MDSFIELFAVSPLVLVVLFFVAILAGFIDSLAGGGGLLTVPALMAAGMPPAQALATNKLQACGGSLSATLYFVRRKVVNLADQKLNILMTFIGSNRRSAAGAARAIRYSEADPAVAGDWHRPLFPADAETGRSRPAASALRSAVCAGRRR